MEDTSQLITSDASLLRDDVLLVYKRRDKVEKLFDIVKNELDSNRLRVRSKDALEGRLLLVFISLILHGEIYRRLKASRLNKTYSVSEVLLKMKKWRNVEVVNGQRILTEMSKDQRNILNALKISIPDEPGC